MFEYDAASRLLKLTLGNGASTAYSYDAAGRLTAFDHANAQAARLLRHDWGYDALGRKGDIAVDIPGFTTASGFNAIDVEYDAASQLASERRIRAGDTSSSATTPAGGCFA